MCISLAYCFDFMEDFLCMMNIFASLKKLEKSGT